MFLSQTFFQVGNAMKPPSNLVVGHIMRLSCRRETVSALKSVYFNATHSAAVTGDYLSHSSLVGGAAVFW